MAEPLRGDPANLWNKVMGREKGRNLPDVSDNATGQGLRQFWMRLSKRPEQGAFSKAISNQMESTYLTPLLPHPNSLPPELK
jgi:hypothetical protein